MFSENLKAMRKAKGYTQEELAISAWAVAGLIWSCQSTEQRPSGLKLSRNR